MIISDRHRFVFVHIPKCAGVSVKRQLRSIDDSAGDFSRIGDHPELGKIHFAHIPLSDLKVHFPDVHLRLCSYRSMALVRDPVDRFISAVFQRLREFKGFNQSAITPKRFAAEAKNVTRHLASTPERLSLEYVHFNRQADYVLEDGRRLVGQVFRLDQLSRAADYIAECTDVRIEQENWLNRSAELKVGRLAPLARLIRVPYAFALPLAVRQKIRSAMLGSGLYGGVTKERFVMPGSWLSDFLLEYYREDFDLFANARHPRAATAEAPTDARCPAQA